MDRDELVDVVGVEVEHILAEIIISHLAPQVAGTGTDVAVSAPVTKKCEMELFA